MLLKDDNLGLGAKRGGKEREETFGSGQLSDIYGRLNGKSQGKLEEEQRARADLGAKLYVQQRFGALPFVRGGYLVGDRIEEGQPPAVRQEAAILPKLASEAVLEDSAPKKRKGSKQDATNLAKDDLEGAAEPKEAETKEERRHRKEERRKAKAALKEEKAARRAAREERRHHKAEKRLRKAAHAKEAQDASQAEDAQKVEEDTPSVPASVQPPASPAATSGDSTPTTNNPFNKRNAVRQRFIRQKRMASMDPQALREILMLKA